MGSRCGALLETAKLIQSSTFVPITLALTWFTLSLSELIIPSEEHYRVQRWYTWGHQNVTTATTFALSKRWGTILVSLVLIGGSVFTGLPSKYRKDRWVARQFPDKSFQNTSTLRDVKQLPPESRMPENYLRQPYRHFKQAVVSEELNTVSVRWFSFPLTNHFVTLCLLVFIFVRQFHWAFLAI